MAIWKGIGGWKNFLNMKGMNLLTSYHLPWRCQQPSIIRTCPVNFKLRLHVKQFCWTIHQNEISHSNKRGEKKRKRDKRVGSNADTECCTEWSMTSSAARDEAECLQDVLITNRHLIWVHSLTDLHPSDFNNFCAHSNPYNIWGLKSRVRMLWWGHFFPTIIHDNAFSSPPWRHRLASLLEGVWVHGH